MRSVECTQVVIFEGGPQNIRLAAVSVLCSLSCASLVPLSPTRPSTMSPAPAPLPSPLPLQYGFTPLHLAARFGHLDIFRLLLDEVADKEARDKVREECRVGALDGRCMAVQWVVEDPQRRRRAASSLIPCLLCPLAFGAFPAELEPALLARVLDSCALSNARKLCFLRGSAKCPTWRLCLCRGSPLVIP